MDFRMRRCAAAILVLCASRVNAQVDVTTYHNDNLRSGLNSHESLLTPANVNSTQFGKLFTVSVDGSVHAQPLVVTNVSVAGAAHNVVYVATQHDSIYAIDADSGRIYWQKSPFYLYGYQLTLDPNKTVKSLTLPNNRNVVLLAAFLESSSSPPPPPPPPPPSGPTAVNFATSANVHGIGTDGSPVAAGGLDGAGDAYSSSQLTASVSWSGTTFALLGAGIADVVSNITVPLPAGSFSTLQLLGSAVHGNQLNQNFIITYTHGSMITVQQSLSDWFTPQGFSGEAKAATTAYRLLSNGSKGTGPFYLYGYAFSLDPHKTVKTLTLPGNRNVVALAAQLLP